MTSPQATTRQSNPTKAMAFGLLGAAVGGCAGYFAFFWLVHQGFYALALPGGLLGWVAGLAARERSVPLAIVCMVAALGLGLYTEWRFAPFLLDRSLGYFLTHLHKMQTVTMIMLAFGAVLGGSLALRRKSAPAA